MGANDPLLPLPLTMVDWLLVPRAAIPAE